MPSARVTSTIAGGPPQAPPPLERRNTTRIVSAAQAGFPQSVAGGAGIQRRRLDAGYGRRLADAGARIGVSGRRGGGCLRPAPVADLLAIVDVGERSGVERVDARGGCFARDA